MRVQLAVPFSDNFLIRTVLRLLLWYSVIKLSIHPLLTQWERHLIQLISVIVITCNELLTVHHV